MKAIPDYFAARNISAQTSIYSRRNTDPVFFLDRPGTFFPNSERLRFRYPSPKIHLLARTKFSGFGYRAIKLGRILASLVRVFSQHVIFHTELKEFARSKLPIALLLTNKNCCVMIRIAKTISS